jgi:aminopeptidase N
MDIRDIRLDLKVDVQKKTVDGEATIQLRDKQPTQSVRLNAVGFEIQEVTLASGSQTAVPAKYAYDGSYLIVNLGSRWHPGQDGTLRVRYRLDNPKSGLHFFAPSKSEPDAPLLVWSQGESTFNRYWFPCFDQPDQRQTSQLVVTVPEGFEVVSNGKLLGRKPNADKTVTFDWRQDKPHPAYLVTLVVGQFDVVEEEWDGIPVMYYVPKGRRDEVAPTFAHTREMLTFFSHRFGIHYPWDKYAQVMCYQFGGGMENTSATTMGDRILLDQRSLLDRTSDWIISHEMAHQWWGDMVTCRDWSHTWLNEGFASYAEALWAEHDKGRDEYAHNMYQKAGGAISGGKTRPIMDRHYTSPDSMFDNRSYPKGAWVLHMLRQHVGDEPFFKGLAQYGNAFRFQSAETDDFRRVMERTTGRDLERFFYDWLERPGNPDVSVSIEEIPDSQQARVVIKQTQAGEAFHIPLKLVFHCEASRTPTVIEQEMTDKELTIQVPLSSTLVRVDTDPDQALLTDLKVTQSNDLWRAQLLEGPDVVSRIRAAKHFAESKAGAERELLARAFTAERYWAVKTELASALGAGKDKVGREALVQGLHDADARVRRASVENLGKSGHDAHTVTVLKEILEKGDPSYGVAGAALTAYAEQGAKDAVAVITPWLSKPSHQHILTSDALRALAATNDPATVETLLSWTQTAKPQECRGAALRGLTQLAKNKNLTRALHQQITKALVSAVESQNRTILMNVLFALPDMETVPPALLAAVDKLSKDAPEERIREMIKGIADRMRSKAAPSGAGASSEVAQLRAEIDKLRRDQEKLRERLDRYEKTAQNGQKATVGAGGGR